MSDPVAIPRRPPLRERDAELATALGSSPTVLLWRTRLPTIRVVRARRCARGRIVGRESWWDVGLEADDGWCAEGELVDVEGLVDIDAVMTELSALPLDIATRGRVRSLVFWLLWGELWLASSRLHACMMDATWVEVE